MDMNLKSKIILFLTPLIIIPVLVIGVASLCKIKESTEARFNTGITTLLDQVSRHSVDTAFKANEDEATLHESALDLAGLMNVINTTTVGDSGYLLLIDASGEILHLPKSIPLSSAENHLRLLGEKLVMEGSAIRTEIEVDGDIIFAYRKELASGMNVIAFLPEADVRNASYTQSKGLIFMTLAMALFVLVAVLMLLRYLVIKPVEALNAAAQAISSGNLNVDIDTGRSDEIGQLSRHLFEVNKKLRQTHEEANYLENHDSLTGLPNDRMFGDYLENILAVARTRKHRLALLFIKLDNLKAINDSHGQAGGDSVLKEMAARLNGSLRKHTDEAGEQHDKACDIVCRYAADDFIVLLDNIDGPWDATVVSDRILKSLHKPVTVNNEDVAISCSIGATVYPDDSLSAQELIKNADIAMYRAKERGENHYQFFSDKTDTVMHRHLKIYSRLRTAIDNDQFFMDYQPKLDSVTGVLVGMEALIRWQDPEDGLIEPEVFLPIAEDSGLISEITKWSIHNVCRQGANWFSSGRLTVPIAVNISAIEFKRFDLLAVITSCLKETELPPELLELELTETSLLSGTDHIIEIFTSLRELGVSIALNNFGTGYSSLSYLNRLPINTLKIDRSFVGEIKSQDDDCAIINSIIALGHALNLSIVADGVETEIQRGYLNSKGCDVMQGFLFNVPLSVEDMTLKLDESLVVDA
ncbi:putative bifunctional diguanylate cyclase/phosphodiesterase [Pseudomonadota bacterium]